MKYVFTYFAFVTFLFATGPSYAYIELTPIATHENSAILFKTYRNMNTMGQVQKMVLDMDGLLYLVQVSGMKKLHIRPMNILKTIIL